MAKYIDADALEKELKRWYYSLTWEDAPEKSTVMEAMVVLKEQPAMDVEEIVHCRDCRWFYEAINSEGEMVCECQYFYFDMENGEGYCSEGRKNNAD